MPTATGRQDVEFQFALEIRELGLMMVRFDTWMQQAHKRQEWDSFGELERRRLSIQYRRSNLMAEAFAWRRKR
ncbi:MAG TPA: hypothetical protein VNG35_02520 [Gemmatimonadales bacterium]|nr:hypothetical protein [Gemmatimonadales bacterium]